MSEPVAYNPNWLAGLAVGFDVRGKSYAEPLDSNEYRNRVRYVKNQDKSNVQVSGDFFNLEI